MAAVAAAAAAAAAASGLADLRQASAPSCPSAELQRSAAARLAAVDELLATTPSMEELATLPAADADRLRAQLLPLVKKLGATLQRVRAVWAQGMACPVAFRDPANARAASHPFLPPPTPFPLPPLCAPQMDTAVTARAAAQPRAPRPPAQLYLSLLGALRSLAGVPALAAVRSRLHSHPGGLHAEAECSTHMPGSLFLPFPAAAGRRGGPAQGPHHRARVPGDSARAGKGLHARGCCREGGLCMRDFPPDSPRSLPAQPPLPLPPAWR